MAPKNPEEAARREPGMTAVLSINPVGSFVLQASSRRGELIRADFNVSGSWSLVFVRDSDWRIAAFRVGVDHRSRRVQLDLRAARSLDDGGVEGRARTRIRGRRTLTRAIHINAGGSWNSRYRDTRRGGAKIVGEASAETAGDGGSVISRRRLDAGGRELWSLSASTQARPRRSGQAGSPAGRVVLLTNSSVDYAQGGHGTSRVLSSAEPFEKKEKSQWRPVSSSPGSSATEKTTKNPDGSFTTTRITKVDGGGTKYETTIDSPDRDLPDGRTASDSTVSTHRHRQRSAWTNRR